MLGRTSQDETPALSKAEQQATKRRKDIADLEALAERLTADRAAIDLKVPELVEREQELRRTAVRQDPSRRSDWKGAKGESTQVMLERQKLERSIEPIESELAAVAIELKVLRDEEAEAVFAEALAGVKWFDDCGVEGPSR